MMVCRSLVPIKVLVHAVEDAGTRCRGHLRETGVCISHRICSQSAVAAGCQGGTVKQTNQNRHERTEQEEISRRV